MSRTGLDRFGVDLGDREQTEMKWCGGPDGADRYRSLGRRDRSADLRRLFAGLEGGDQPTAWVEWSGRLPDRSSVRLDAELSCRFETPYLRAEVIWSSPDLSVVRAGQDGMVELAVEGASALPATFLNVTDDAPDYRQALDVAQGRMLLNPVGEGELRSYSWVVHLNREQLDSVGGIAVLARRGAFFALVAVPGPRGGAVLRATEDLADYVGPRVRAVRDALSPLLPTTPVVREPDGLRLAWDDGTSGPFRPPEGDYWPQRESQ